ncbi:Sel1 repeat protein [compost metagenome]
MDVTAAAQHYRLAAQAELDWGLYNFANLLATGRGIAQDNGRALNCYRQAAQLGHAKSMNLLGRYLEQGLHCTPDREAAAQWYRRSAEAGDFRGQFSHAAVLADQGLIEQAVVWLRKALAGGNLNFLRVSTQALLQAGHAQIRAIAQEYQARLLELESQANINL